MTSTPPPHLTKTASHLSHPPSHLSRTQSHFSTASSCSAQDLSLTAYSFALLGYLPPESWWARFWASSKARMGQASSQALANMFWALGRLRKVGQGEKVTRQRTSQQKMPSGKSRGLWFVMFSMPHALPPHPHLTPTAQTNAPVPSRQAYHAHTHHAHSTCIPASLLPVPGPTACVAPLLPRPQGRRPSPRIRPSHCHIPSPPPAKLFTPLALSIPCAPPVHTLTDAHGPPTLHACCRPPNVRGYCLSWPTWTLPFPMHQAKLWQTPYGLLVGCS
jgi:hypothetical protein